ncbi:MAG: bifunctional diguanylate cyclase/phosphodiesterase [Firmicutes bacterium]|nr:bifunctional diguanylate cyclase/phosphodiesterase [Bacillota bacterium]
MFRKIKTNKIDFIIVFFFIYIVLNILLIFNFDWLASIFIKDLGNLNQVKKFKNIGYILFSALFFFIFTYQALKIQSYSKISGLPNKRAFKRVLKEEINSAEKAGLKLALYFVNLDNFKSINDAYGYIYGDRLLGKVGMTLKEIFKENYKVFHISADEYVVLKNNVEFISEVVWTAESLKNLFNKFWQAGDNWHFLNATTGIVVYPDDGQKPDVLIRKVHTATHFAKTRKKGSYELYQNSMNEEMEENKRIEAQIKVALEKKQFLIFYQPQIDICDNSIIGAEALIRWPNGKGGFTPPSKFIPIAEMSGLINPIGDFVFESVCMTIKEWLDSGIKPVRISVNLSPRQFRDGDLLEDIKEVLKKTNISSQWLALEITEGALMEDTDCSITLLDNLKKMGIKVYLDDFGTGYSSLYYLKRFPIDVLKIDKSFIQGINTDPREDAIVKTIIALGHDLGIKVEAEGVENEEQLKYLKDNGCDYVQGFLISKPLPKEKFEKLLF